MTQVPNNPPPRPPEDDAPVTEGARFAQANHILLIFLGLVVVVWLLSGIYQVNNDQVAIVERLGTYISTSEGKALLVDHGLHYHLPWPIDRVHKISIQQRRTLPVKRFNESPEAYTDIKRDLQKRGYRQEIISSLFDPYLITGDRNVVHMELAVHYLVDDPEAWLNTISHSSKASDDALGEREDLFQEIAQHALTSEIARHSVDRVLFEQAQLPPMLLQAMERDLLVKDSAGKMMKMMGIHIQAVDLVSARPPERVADAFGQVGRYRADASAAIVQATANAAGAQVQAEARKTTLILEAQAYRNRVVNAAQGEAERFRQVLQQYEKSPDVTRWNLYVEAVKSVTGNANRIFFAQPGQRTTIYIDPPQFDVNQVAPK